MEAHPCFLHLSPTILQAYHDACETLDKADVFGEEMLEFQDKIDKIRKYNKFFQLRQNPDTMSSPHFTNIPSTSKVYICDFKGWKGRLLVDEDTIRDYTKCYHFTIDEGTPDLTVTIWRWQPRVAVTNCDQRAGQEGTGTSRESRHGNCKIREIFKGVYCNALSVC